MLEKETEHQNAGNYAWFAARDARMKSYANSTNFSEKQKVLAERVKLGLELTYSCKEVSITYCKKWVRVKVHSGVVKDKKNLALLENDWSNQGITKVFTSQGVIYHVA